MKIVKKESFYWSSDEAHCFNNVYHFLDCLYERTVDKELESACKNAMNALNAVAEFCEGIED